MDQWKIINKMRALKYDEKSHEFFESKDILSKT